jgi:hypothetical protein
MRQGEFVNVRKALRINAEYRAAESANPPAAP